MKNAILGSIFANWLVGAVGGWGLPLLTGPTGPIDTTPFAIQFILILKLVPLVPLVPFPEEFEFPKLNGLHGAVVGCCPAVCPVCPVWPVWPPTVVCPPVKNRKILIFIWKKIIILFTYVSNRMQYQQSRQYNFRMI